MIQRINDIEYEKFLRANNAEKKQVSISTKGEHYGYFKNEKLIGVISTFDTKNRRRVKGFLVNQRHQGQGIGKELLQYILTNNKDMTAFATVYSQKLFENFGFNVESEKGNNIKFMKRTLKIRPQITEDEIELIKNSLGEVAVKLLEIEKDRQKIVADYTIKKIKELIR